MKSKRGRLVILALAGIFLAGVCPGVLAEKWQPYQFPGDERFEYKVTWETRKEMKEAVYVLDIKKSGRKSEEGGEIFEVSYTTKGTLKKKDMEKGAAFGFWGTYGVSLSTIVLNPLYGVYLTQADLKVGEKMSFYGAGLLKVTGKEKIAGREGLVCQLFQTRNNQEELAAEWVIDLKLALPLRSKVFRKGKIQSEAELTKYSRR